MKLTQIVNIIKQVSKEYPAIKEFGEGDVYQYLNSGEHKYPCIFLTIESINTTGTTPSINAVLFFIDRLLADSSNKLDIQSVGVTALGNIIQRILDEIDNISFGTSSYSPFTEKFSDLCAGVFTRCTISLLDDIECGDDFIKTALTVRENGVYDLIGYSQVLVMVPQVIGVKSIGGKQGKIKLGNRLSISDENVLNITFPELISGENINITSTDEGYIFDVDDMRYDDSAVLAKLAEIDELYDEIASKVDYIYREQEKMFYDILLTRFLGKKLEINE